MPSRTTTNYVSHAMTEMEIKQANKTTMFVLGGLRRPKEAWIVAAQAQKDREDARQRSHNKRKIPILTEAPTSKRSRKSVLSQEEKDRKLQEQRARYNQKRREARAELRKKKQSITKQMVRDKQPKTGQPSTASLDTEEMSIMHRSRLEQENLTRDQLLEQQPVDTIDSAGEDNCADEELADLIAAQLDDVSDNEQQLCTGDDFEENHAEIINSEVEGSQLKGPQEKIDNNEQILLSTPELSRDAGNESSEESEEE